ncbi:BRO-N domain-containing protein [Pseudomonas chlororaphis]|uniref:BRO-N domain-containing protein n=1 Tax=Pseudomonas chlororaphis TaxID=587753 RepID=UPI0013DE4AAD
MARAAGLKNPSSTVGSFKASKACAMHRTIGDTVETYRNAVGSIPKAPHGRAYHPSTALLDEPMVYQMLLRSRSPASEPFRKWVTEEVLPTSARPVNTTLSSQLTQLPWASWTN